MNDRELKKARIKYKEIQTEKEYYLSKKQELKELKKDPKVQKYIETIKYLNMHSDEEYEKDMIISKAFENISTNTQDSSNILVFVGFRDDYDNVIIDPKKIDYAAFMDLETMQAYNVQPTNYYEFCKDKNIVYFDDPYSRHNSGYYMKKFFELRNEYLSNLVLLDQEKAKKMILRK